MHTSVVAHSRLRPQELTCFQKIALSLALRCCLGLATFVERLVFPVGWNIPWINFQLGFFAQYVALFIVGLIAFLSRGWTTIPKETGRFWSKIAVLLFPVLIVILVSGFLFGGGINAFLGGFNWQAAAYALWEQLFAVAVCIGSTIWFREKVNFQNRFAKALQQYSSFAAYIIQVPILVFLGLSFQSTQLPLLLKFGIVSCIGVPLCFGSAYLIKKIPKVERVL